VARPRCHGAFEKRREFSFLRDTGFVRQTGQFTDLLMGFAFGFLGHQDGAYVDVSADTLHAEKDCEQNARSE
jgi:hypothetical protein